MWKWSLKGIWKNRWKGTHNQDIVCEKTNYFNKKKNKTKQKSFCYRNFLCSYLGLKICSYFAAFLLL